MNKEAVQKLYEDGAIYVILNVPEGTQFGIDLKTWNTGEKFRGIKMIPPGIHYIFFSAVCDSTGDTAPRTGFFHNFKSGEILVKKWDKFNETISKEEISEDEIVKLKDNLQALDGFLGPYPYSIHGKWLNLTTHITECLITRLNPVSGFIQSVLELESCSDKDRPRGSKIPKLTDQEDSLNEPIKLITSKNREEGFLPILKAKEGTEIQISKFPEKNYPEGSTPAEITRHSMDSSFVLDLMLANYTDSLEILGEMEFCYISFLVGHSLEAFDQWKRLFTLLCSCDVAIKKHRRIYDAFLSLAEVQIKEIPEDFLVDIVANNNFVYMKLRQLFLTVQESNVDGMLKNKVERLKEKLTQDFQWDFGHLESEDDSDAPVVVDVNE